MRLVLAGRRRAARPTPTASRLAKRGRRRDELGWTHGAPAFDSVRLEIEVIVSEELGFQIIPRK